MNNFVPRRVPLRNEISRGSKNSAGSLKWKNHPTRPRLQNSFTCVPIESRSPNRVRSIRSGIRSFYRDSRAARPPWISWWKIEGSVAPGITTNRTKIKVGHTMGATVPWFTRLRLRHPSKCLLYSVDFFSFSLFDASRPLPVASCFEKGARGSVEGAEIIALNFRPSDIDGHVLLLDVCVYTCVFFGRAYGPKTFS